MVSIIILSYNTEKILGDCLDSITAHVNQKVEVIVVDNGSTDGTIQMLEKEHKKVILVKNKKNVGFSRGCNMAAKIAKGEYVFFLNSDTVLRNNPLPDLCLVSNQENGVVAGGILQNKDETWQRSFGSFYSLGKVFILLFLGENFRRLQVKTDTIQQVDWVSGGCMLVKKDIFDKLNGFDEHFFMYVEDMEFCYRVKKSGYKVYTCPNARVFHVGQGSSSRAFAIAHIYKGLLYFYQKHKSGLETYILLLLLKIKAYSGIIIGLLTGNSSLRTTYIAALQSI